MSNTRQFLVPLNYDITKQIYPSEEFVRKRIYLIDDIKSAKQYRKIYIKTFADETSSEPKCYADKLRLRAKYR